MTKITKVAIKTSSGKIATKAGQAKGMQTKFLHSTNLKKK